MMLLTTKKGALCKMDSRTRRIEGKTLKEGLRCAIFDNNGDVYKGEWAHDKKNGRGVLFTRNNLLCYEGEFKDNKRHGNGTLSIRINTNNTYALLYRGAWHKDKLSGNGLRVYLQGGFYEGSFKNDRRDGSGQIWYIDGSSYSGNWVAGVRHGKGILIEKNGNRYEGNWEQDKQHGPGKYYFFNRGQLLLGEWRDGICRCGTMVDIPYRAAAEFPTPHPLPKLQLEHDVIYFKSRTQLKIDNSDVIKGKSKKEKFNISFYLLKKKISPIDGSIIQKKYK